MPDEVAIHDLALDSLQQSSVRRIRVAMTERAGILSHAERLYGAQRKRLIINLTIIERSTNAPRIPRGVGQSTIMLIARTIIFLIIKLEIHFRRDEGTPTKSTITDLSVCTGRNGTVNDSNRISCHPQSRPR